MGKVQTRRTGMLPEVSTAPAVLDSDDLDKVVTDVVLRAAGNCLLALRMPSSRAWRAADSHRLTSLVRAARLAKKASAKPAQTRK